MKRLLALFVSLVLTFLALPIAHASSIVLLTEPTHRQINGQYIDDDLASSLGVVGRLGKLVFDPPAGERTWFIDPALIEEIQAMADGYTLTSGTTGVGQLFAKSWLAQLQVVTQTDNVAAIAYGNPSLFWVKQLSPHEVNYVLTISGRRLGALLGRLVGSATSYHSNRRFGIAETEIAAIKSDTNDFAMTAAYIDPTSIDTSRLALIKILNPDLTQARREYLIRNFTAAAFNQMHLVHLSTGKFTVTSTHQNLPITITNGFPTNIKVNLSVIPTNLKVEVPTQPQISIPANSKIQVMVPITVLTSGTSGLNVELTSSHGDPLGDPIIYPLNLAVISPVATWFTTGAAIVLFLAATFQSLRRIRRRRK